LPPVPIPLGPGKLVPELGQSLQGFGAGLLKGAGLNTDFVAKLFTGVLEVKEAAHACCRR
jgi:hypothetical protein